MIRSTSRAMIQEAFPKLPVTSLRCVGRLFPATRSSSRSTRDSRSRPDPRNHGRDAPGRQIQGITVVSTASEPADLPKNVSWRVHDPEDRSKIAYLASTSEGRRVYLSRYLTDADIVIPIGNLGYDGTLGYRGPWSVIYPGLSDSETLARFRTLNAEGVADRERPSASLVESAEVTWLLGCQFQVGMLSGVSGISKIVAGLESSVRTEGAVAVDENWSFEVPERADVVVAGIGLRVNRPRSTTFPRGSPRARLVRRGGKRIVALSSGPRRNGSALRRLTGAAPGSSVGCQKSR